MIINAEEALDAIEGADLLDRVLIALRVRLFLGSISAEVKEGEARVEEVGHFWLAGGAAASADSLVSSKFAAAVKGCPCLRVRPRRARELSNRISAGRPRGLPRGSRRLCLAVWRTAHDFWLPRLPLMSSRAEICDG